MKAKRKQKRGPYKKHNYWTRRNGDKIKIADMNILYILNCLRLCLRLAKEKNDRPACYRCGAVTSEPEWVIKHYPVYADLTIEYGKRLKTIQARGV